jgi:hypothetical protein
MVALDQSRSSSAVDRESRGFPATADRSGQKGRFHPEVRLVGGDGTVPLLFFFRDHDANHSMVVEAQSQ